MKTQSNTKINKTFVLTLALLLICTLNLKAQWTAQSIGSSSLYLSSVYFVNANTGYAAGIGLYEQMGVILKTTDGGANWTQTIFDASNIELYSIYFVNKNIGYAVGYDWWTQVCIVLKTTDGGNTWINQSLNIKGLELYSVYFVDANTGFAVGGNLDKENYTLTDCILKTTDGGLHWTTKTNGLNTSYNSVFFVDANTGYVAGYNVHNNAVLMKTTDGGENWVSKNSGISDSPELYAVYFPSANIGYAVGRTGGYNYSGVIYKTVDGGNNWTLQKNVEKSYLLDVEFPETNIGYVVGYDGNGNGLILKTIDGGLNWVQQNYDSENELSSVCFVNKNIGYTVGNKSTVFKTTNGGGTPDNIQSYKEEPTNIYPNPAYDQLTIENTNSLIRNIRLYDLSGKTIQNVSNINRYQITIPLPEVEQGLYFISVTCDEGFITKKVIVR
jgi:photosystem II stability/assembly factor-like uncharacterized protein